MQDPARTWTRLQLAAVALGLAGLALGLGLAVTASPQFAFLRQAPGAAWITAPDPPHTGAEAAPVGAIPVVEFRRRFRAPSHGTLHVQLQALRGFTLDLNGRRVAERRFDAGNWKREVRLALEPGLRAGENLLEVRVQNPTGPAALRLRAEAERTQIGSDESWQVRTPGGEWTAAVPADDTRRAPATYAAPRASSLVASGSGRPIALFALGCLLAILARGRLGRVRGVPVTLGAGLLLAALWLGLALKGLRLPTYMGFDGPGHLAYVQHLLEQRALPLAGDGAMMYHPPLFYALGAGLIALAGGGPGAERLVLRALTLLAGLAQIGVALGLARRLFPGDRRLACGAALAAGFLPVNLYMSVYLSNEALHGALAACSLLVAADLLLAPGLHRGRLLALGLLLGLAVLTKPTSLVLLPLVGVCLLAKARLADLSPAPRALASVAGMLAVAALVCGWFFLRNQLALGRPLVGNWDVPGAGVAWWQHPGFHTRAWYLSFGESLVRPFFSAFASFWDGLYSTLWGDGLIGGVAAWPDRHPLWSYADMARVYWLALPASAIALAGFGGLAAEALRGDDLRRRIALTFLVAAMAATGIALGLLTLRLPAYSMAKASYTLGVAAPAALAVAYGYAALVRRLEAWRQGWLTVPLHGWAFTLLASIALAFLG